MSTYTCSLLVQVKAGFMLSPVSMAIKHSYSIRFLSRANQQSKLPVPHTLLLASLIRHTSLMESMGMRLLVPKGKQYVLIVTHPSLTFTSLSLQSTFVYNIIIPHPAITLQVNHSHYPQFNPSAPYQPFHAFYRQIIITNRMLLGKLCFLLALLACCSASLTQDEPNESCSWRGFKQCPIDSSGSNPICDNTNPTEISPGVFGMRICASQTPKAIGGKFDVGLATYGTILTVDVIPESTPDNNVHCTDGAGSVGTRVFYAHCEVSGPGKIRGYWAITYKVGGAEEEVQQ